MINLTINDKKITLDGPMSVLDAAGLNDITIPHFCDHPMLEKFGGCRMCLVEVEGARGLQASCTLQASEGLVVQTETAEVVKARKAVLEFLLINHPLDCPACDKAGECKLQDYSYMYGPAEGRFEETKFREKESTDDPLIVRNMERCITCTRCVRACTQVQGASAISVVGRGKQSFIEPYSGKNFDCEYCGSCITVCPVGSLMSSLHRHNYRPWETTAKVETICPFCGVGCAITLQMRGQSIQRAMPKYRAGVNEGILCSRGYFGYEFPENPRRLTSPLIKKNGKFVPVSYEQALTHIHERMSSIAKENGPQSVAAIASGWCSNEDNYMLQKYMRGALNTDNIDSTASMGLSATREVFDYLLGAGSTSSPISEIANSDAILVLGGDPCIDSPVLGVRIRNAHMKGGFVSTLGQAMGLYTHSTIYIQCTIGHEGHALAAILAQVIEAKGMPDTDSPAHTLAKKLKLPSLQSLASTANTEQIRTTAQQLAGASAVSIVIGRGLAGDKHGARNLSIAAVLARILNAKIYVSSITPNENGLLDMGCAPGTLVGNVPLDALKTEQDIAHAYERAWGRPLKSIPKGLTLTESLDAAHTGTVKAMYIMGTNPVNSLPGEKTVKESLMNLDFLVVQDLFMNDTTELADVIIPSRGWPEKNGTIVNLERRIQLLKKAIDRTELMADWEILATLCRMAGMNAEYKNASEVCSEICNLSPLYDSMDYEELEKGVNIFPYKGTPYTRINPPAYLVNPAADILNIPEDPTSYGANDLIALPVRPLPYAGTLSRYSDALLTISKEPLAVINQATADKHKLEDKGITIVSTEHGEGLFTIFLDKRVPDDVVFMTNSFKGNEFISLIGYNIEPNTQTPYIEAVPITLKKGG